MKKLLTLLAVLSLVLLVGTAQAEKKDKVCIEHQGDEGPEYISINENALEAHLAHGDTPADPVNCSKEEEE